MKSPTEANIQGLDLRLQKLITFISRLGERNSMKGKLTLTCLIWLLLWMFAEPGRLQGQVMPHAQLARKPHHTEGVLHGISQADSMNCSFYFLKGLGNKVSSNMEAAQENFRESLRYNPANDAAWYELALARLNARQYPEALNFINKALYYKPGQIWYLNLLATIYDQTSERELLAGVYQKMERIEPENVNYDLAEAAALAAAGHDASAVEVYDKIEKWVGVSEEMEFQKQKLFVHMGKPGMAVSSMQKLIQDHPAEPRYYLLLADLYRADGKPGLVLSSLKKAVDIDSANGFAQLALADYYRSQGQQAGAFRALKNAFASSEVDAEQKKKLLEDNYVNVPAANQTEGRELARTLALSEPEDTQAQALYAAFLNQSPETSTQGRSDLIKMLEGNHENYALWANLIVSDFNLGDYNGAARHASEAMTYFPNQINLYWYSGIALNQAGKSREAIAILDKGIELAQGQNEYLGQLYQVLGDAFHAAGETKSSDKAYDESLKIRPDDAGTLNNYGYFLCLRKKDLDRAETMLRRANSLEPGNANYEDTFAWILYQQGRYDDALNWIQRSISHDAGRNPTLLEHCGDILFRLGNVGAALENWKKAKAYGSKNLNLSRKIANRKLYE